MNEFGPQRNTIRTSSHIEGVGLHSGQRCAVTLSPLGSGSGIVVNGTRLTHGVIVSTDLATSIQTEGGVISTIEHLTAALVGQGIDDISVRVEGGEVPVLDGSALPWLSHLDPVPSDPLKPASVLKLDEVLEVAQGEAYIRAEPSDRLMIEVEVDYPGIGQSRYACDAGDWTQAAAARTFGFLEHHTALLERGLAQGAALENTLVFGQDGRPLNEGGLRMDDEVARHKWLDCLGDLALLGERLVAKIRVVRGGHRVHHALVRALSERSG
mgnify:CR=1 FL=1